MNVCLTSVECSTAQKNGRIFTILNMWAYLGHILRVFLPIWSKSDMTTLLLRLSLWKQNVLVTNVPKKILFRELPLVILNTAFRAVYLKIGSTDYDKVLMKRGY